MTSGAQLEKDEPFHKFYADLSLKINFLATGRSFSFSSASRPASILGHVPRPDYKALLCGHGGDTGCVTQWRRIWIERCDFLIRLPGFYTNLIAISLPFGRKSPPGDPWFHGVYWGRLDPICPACSPDRSIIPFEQMVEKIGEGKSSMCHTRQRKSILLWVSFSEECLAEIISSLIEIQFNQKFKTISSNLVNNCLCFICKFKWKQIINIHQIFKQIFLRELPCLIRKTWRKSDKFLFQANRKSDLSTMLRVLIDCAVQSRVTPSSCHGYWFTTRERLRVTPRRWEDWCEMEKEG